MTIHSEISANKTKTYFIIFLFIVFITFFFFLIGKFVGNSSMYFTIGILFSLFSSIGSYFYADKLVLFMSGAKLADKNQYFDLYTAVENMSIASGLPMPKVYVMEDPSANAFATGRNPKHSVIAATSGLLQILNKAELEAVIAHEMSHIKNYDILVMSIVSVLVGTVTFIADWILRTMAWGGFRKDRDNNNSSSLALFAFVIVLIVSYVAAGLIQLAISRRREYLADASGALLNRNPDALADALLKIQKDPHVLHTATNATAHLFIENPFHKESIQQGGFINKIAALFSTHPPIEERVRLLRDM